MVVELVRYFVGVSSKEVIVWVYKIEFNVNCYELF